MNGEISVAQFKSLLPREDDLTRMHQREKIKRNGDHAEFLELLHRDLGVSFEDMPKTSDTSGTDDNGSKDFFASLRRMGYTTSDERLSARSLSLKLELGELTWIGEAQNDSKFGVEQLQLITLYSGPAASIFRPAGHSPQELFYFELKGRAASGTAMIAGTAAELHFRYDIPPADAIATVVHPAVDAARQADLDIELQLTPRGSIAIEGNRRRVARMRGGRLSEPVTFRLLAGPAQAVNLSASGASADNRLTGEAGVHVDFVVKGETVHQALLTINILSASSPLTFDAGSHPVDVGRVPTSLFADAAAVSRVPQHRVRLTLSMDGSGLRMDLQHLINGEDEASDSATAVKVDAAQLAASLAATLSPLADSYIGSVWKRFTGVLPEGEGLGPVQAALARALECVATAGYTLNSALRADVGLRRLLDYIEAKVPEGAVLTVTTESVFLPWELLTCQQWSQSRSPGQIKAAPFPDRTLFWGARFAIETVLAGAAPVGERKRIHLQASPSVSVNLNPKISMQGVPAEEQPLQVQKAWAISLGERQLLERKVNEHCVRMREVLQDADTSASLIYLYCHGSSGDALDGINEVLQLDDGCVIAPPDVRGDLLYRAAPIVFLNACQTGSHSPLAYSNFLREFNRRGAIGLIATSHSVPITFGAHFGPQVVNRYLERRGSLATTLLQMRRLHLIERGNPVPLFYTLQCQLSFP